MFLDNYTGKNIGKNIIKKIIGKYSQTFLDHAKQSAKTEAAGNLIGNKFTNKIIKVSKNLQKFNLKTVTNKNDKEITKEIPKGRYTSLEKKTKNYWLLRLIYNSIIMEYQKTAEATGDFIANKTTKVSKNSQQNNSEIVTNENDKKIPNERSNLKL